MAVGCNPIRMGIWSELMVVCVCHSDEVMREADANDTPGELGSEFPGSVVGEFVFRPFFGHAGHADPLDDWRCCSQKRVMSRPIQVRQL